MCFYTSREIIISYLCLLHVDWRCVVLYYQSRQNKTMARHTWTVGSSKGTFITVWQVKDSCYFTAEEKVLILFYS